MFFRGFRASLNLNGKKHYDAIEFESANPICGAYRMNRDEFYDNTNEGTQAQSSFIFEPPPPLRPSNDSTLDLPVTLRKKEVSTNPKGAELEHQNSHQDHERRKTFIEMERLAKIKSEKQSNNNKKSKAPAPPPLLIDNFTEKAPISRIDSSIERSLKTSGPPPYDLVSDKLEVIPIRNDIDIENASYNKTDENSLNGKRESDDNKRNIEPVARERKLNKSFLDLNYNIESVNLDSAAKEELL